MPSAGEMAEMLSDMQRSFPIQAAFQSHNSHGQTRITLLPLNLDNR